MWKLEKRHANRIGRDICWMSRGADTTGSWSTEIGDLDERLVVIRDVGAEQPAESAVGFEVPVGLVVASRRIPCGCGHVCVLSQLIGCRET